MGQVNFFFAFSARASTVGLDEGDSHKIVQNRASKISMEDFN